MKSYLLSFAFSMFSFATIFGQGNAVIHFPDSIKTSKIYFSPYAKYTTIPSISGIVKVGDNYDSLLNYEHFDLGDFEDTDSLGTLFEKQQGLTLIVDTTQEIDLREYFSKSHKDYGLYSSPKFITYLTDDNKKFTFRCNKDTSLICKAFPVYIRNNTQQQKAIYLRSIYIEIIQEAIDKNGQWQPIEKRTTFRCGYGFGWKDIKPNEYLVTSVLKYKGNYKTMLRLKFVNGKTIYYSKPFQGSIDYSQLKQNRIRYIDGLPYE